MPWCFPLLEEGRGLIFIHAQVPGTTLQTTAEARGRGMLQAAKGTGWSCAGLFAAAANSSQADQQRAVLGIPLGKRLGLDGSLCYKQDLRAGL